MARVVGVLCISLVLVGCESDRGGGGTGGTTGTSFCAVLAMAATCQSAGPECEKVLTVDAAADDTCLAERDTFLNCISAESLVCASETLLYAGPNAASGSSYSLGNYTVQTSSGCTVQGDAWQSCLRCKERFAAVRQAAEGWFTPSEGAPSCDEAREAFLACALPAGATCPLDAVIEAGATAATGRTFAETLAGVTIHATEDCAKKGDAWLSCGYCGAGLGHGKPGKDVGDPCGATDECAKGLTCKLQHCTAPCDSVGHGAQQDYCTGRTWKDGACRNDSGATPSCSSILKACVTSCDGNDDCEAIQSDGFCPGNGATLLTDDWSVEYGKCFFGPCTDEGCKATDPFP